MERKVEEGEGGKEREWGWGGGVVVVGWWWERQGEWGRREEGRVDGKGSPTLKCASSPGGRNGASGGAHPSPCGMQYSGAST